MSLQHRRWQAPYLRQSDEKALRTVAPAEGTRFIIRPDDYKYEVLDRATGEVCGVFGNQWDAKRVRDKLNKN